MDNLTKEQKELLDYSIEGGYKELEKLLNINKHDDENKHVNDDETIKIKYSF